MPALTAVGNLARRTGAWLRARPPLAVLATAWLLLIGYAFPGQMSADSFEHLIEGRAGFYTDGHPPILGVMSGLSDRVIAGPLGLLVVQSVCALAGLYLIMRRLFAPRAAAWAAAGLFLYPPILMPFAAIWKDCLMAGFLLLGIAGLLDERRRYRLAALVALYMASAVRYNAFAATLPLVVVLFEWRPGLGPLRRYAIALAAWLAITGAAFTTNALLVDQEMHYWHSSLAVHDIAGTLSRVDDLPDAELEQLFAGTGLLVHTDIHARLRRGYAPRNFIGLVTPPGGLWQLPLYGTTPAPAPQRDAVARAWWQVITSYPVAYAQHRLTVMGQVLAIGRPTATEGVPAREYRYPATAIEMGISLRYSAAQLAATDAMTVVWRRTPLFVPWVYLALALMLLPLTRGHRDAFALLASAIVMESSLLVLAPTTDYRYSHWMVVATCIAIVVLTVRRFRRARVRRSGGPGAI